MFTTIRKTAILASLASVLGVLAISSTASAQQPIDPGFSPQPLVVPGPNGTIFISPDRLNPLANMAVPGSHQNVNVYVPGVGYVSGTTWLGFDGKPHSNLNVPNGNGGQDMIVTMSRGGSKTNSGTTPVAPSRGTVRRVR